MRLETVKRLEMAARSTTTRFWMAKLTGTMTTGTRERNLGASITEAAAIKDVAVVMMGGISPTGNTNIIIAIIVMIEATAVDLADTVDTVSVAGTAGRSRSSRTFNAGAGGGF